MEIVHTDAAPSPAGHYSQATVHAGVVYVAGQLPVDPATGEKILGPVEDQVARTVANLAAILAAAGSGLEHVLRTTVYVSDIALWPRVNAAYAAAFGGHRPARAVVPTRELHHGFAVEIDAIAVVPT